MLAPAAWAQAAACSATANVGWSVDNAASTVAGVHVQVPGCANGEWVGIELITHDGDLPGDGPLTAEVSNGVADFDVSELRLPIEPVTGIRVFVLIDGDPVPVIVVTVEQRFFASSGEEQVGLVRISALQVTTGSSYLVPRASAGYTDVACDDVNFDAPGGVVGQGSGEFIGDEPGTHVACYQQVPDTTGGPGPGGAGAGDPEVLGESIEADDELGSVAEGRDGGSTLDDRGRADVEALARTGLNSVGALLVGTLVVMLGGGLVRWRRSGSNP